MMESVSFPKTIEDIFAAEPDLTPMPLNAEYNDPLVAERKHLSKCDPDSMNDELNATLKRTWKRAKRRAAPHQQERPRFFTEDGARQPVRNMLGSGTTIAQADDLRKHFASNTVEHLFKLEKVRPVGFWRLDAHHDICVICRNKLTDPCAGCLGSEYSINEPLLRECKITWGQCKHVFHDHCLTHWLKERYTCPFDQGSWVPAYTDFAIFSAEVDNKELSRSYFGDSDHGHDSESLSAGESDDAMEIMID